MQFGVVVFNAVMISAVVVDKEQEKLSYAKKKTQVRFSVPSLEILKWGVMKF